MGLPEPVSGSHVASATVVVPLLFPPPPYCSSPSPISDPLPFSTANPTSFPLPSSSSVPTPDPAPPAASAAVGGPEPAPAVSDAVDAPDPASSAPVNSLLHRSSASGAPPAASTLLPPLSSSSDRGSSGTSSHQAPPVAPATVGGPVPSPAPALVVDLAPANRHGSSSSPLLSNSSSVGPPSSDLPSSAAKPSPISAAQGLLPPPPVLSTSSLPLASGRSSGAALSYAQATRGPRGSGFVHSHAADVESFARLPRSGINIVCGSREGAPSFSFVASDLTKIEALYSNALVMRFLGGRPSLETSHKEILSWGIEKPFSIGPLSSRAFLLRFQDQKDLVRVLSRPSSTLITFPYRVFRWHNLCHIKEDSCFAPVWVSLPKLPLQCFIPEFLETVANKIGRFLCFDKATATLARPSAARMCVELDLRKIPPPFIWIGLFEGFKQAVIYERMPKFCTHCFSQGHVTSVCPGGQRETLPAQAHPRPDPGPGRPPAARRNAAKHLSSKSHINSTSASFVSSSTPHPHTSTATITQSIPPILTVSSQPVVELRPSESSQLTQSVRQHAPPHISACSSGGNASKMSSNPSEGLVHQQQPHPLIDRQSDTGPNPVATISPQPSSNDRTNQCVSADTQQGQQPGSSPLSGTSPIPPPPNSSHGFQLPNDTPVLPLPADSTLVQTTTMTEPHLSPPTKSKSKTRKIRPKNKSVSFKLPGQSNLSANVDFWSAVNNQISNIEQNHTHISNQSIPLYPSAVPIVDNSHHPSIHPNNPNISTPPSTYPSDKQKRLIATFDTGKIHPALWEAVNRQVSILDQARLTGSPVVQSLLNSCRTTIPNPPDSIPSTSNTNLYSMSPSTSDSEASIAADSPPYSHVSQYDTFSLKHSSYKSEGEDSGTEEARLQGHFSDDMSSAKPKSSRKNKRHPDQPLHVQLRARKGGGY